MRNRTIEAIHEDELIEFKDENVTITGSIAKGAKVIVIDGNLVVKGSVESQAQIKISSPSPNYSCVKVSGSVSVIVNGRVDNCHNEQEKNIGKLFIEGNIRDKVIIQGHQNITILGNIGCNTEITALNSNITVKDISENVTLRTNNGNIECRKLANHVSLTALNGDVKCEAVGDYAKIKTINGNIQANTVGKNASLLTTSGSIEVKEAHPSAELGTVNGSVIVAGVIKSKSKSAADRLISGSIFTTFNSVRTIKLNQSFNLSNVNPKTTFKF